MNHRRLTVTPELRQQRGVATLAVVMVLFFVVSLVAAYASRNIIFEQRTGANYARSTMAQETAEAGLRWAISMLNSGRIDEDCRPSTSAGDDTFRARYLRVDAATGAISAQTYGAGVGTPRAASCVWNPGSAQWVCRCPIGSQPEPAVPGGTAIAPAFRIEFSGAGTQPGLVRLRVAACTRFNTDCLNTSGSPTSLGEQGQGRSVTQATLFMAGQSMSMPEAALTSGGSVNVTGLTVSNSRVGDSGLTIHARGTVSGTISANTQAGNAIEAEQTFVEDDAALQPASLAGSSPVSGRDRFSALLFGVGSQAFREMPNTLVLSCSGTCTGAEIATAAANHPGRPIWVPGGATIETSIGSAAEPVLLMIDGDLAISDASVVIHGLVVVRATDPSAGLDLPDNGRVVGAVVVDSSVVGSGSFAVEYDGPLLRQLRSTAGPYMLVPGGWRDSF